MTFFHFIPALIRLLFVFIIVIICMRKKVSLGHTFLLGGLALGVLFGMMPVDLIKSLVNSVLYPKTLSLSVIVSLILVLSNAMEKTGQMQKLLDNFKGLVKSPRLNITLFPALIGLLPMPGGAVFSAPMVKELGASSGYSPEKLSFINYWFRHIWEYCWPLYPGVLLITVIADVNLGTLILVMCPATILSIGIGHGYLKSEKGHSDTQTRHNRPEIKPFLISLLPILIVILPGVGLGILFARILPELSIARESALIFALILSILWVFKTNHLSKETIKKLLLDPQMVKMIYMVFTILIFKGMLEDSQAVDAIIKELTILKIPLIIIVALLPFLIGIITGITIGFVGSTFPILIPLVLSFYPEGNILPYVMLAMVCGFAGVILSPVHLCLILSNEYFSTTMNRVYRYLWLPCLIIISAAFFYYYLLRLFFKT